MFREPEEVVAEAVAAKLDQAEAQQRSAIRRQPTVRHSRYSTSAARERIRERISERTHRNDQGRHEELQIAQMEAEIGRLRALQRRRARDGQNSPLADTETAWRDAEELLSTSRSIREEDTTLPPLRHARLPRPDRQSSLRFEVGAPQSGSSSPRRRRLLSPPSSSGSGRNGPDGPVPFDQDPDNLTPGFAPARYYANMDTRGLETPPPETWESSLPPLSRSSRRPDRPPHRGIDGLGDRYRSPSPDPAAEEETWAHLLDTMQGGRSSANTSFASNGDSVSRSRASQTTAATSFGEIGVDETCDLDLPIGITEEIARDIREEHRTRERRERRDHSEPDGPLLTGPQALRQHEALTRQRSMRDRPAPAQRDRARASAQVQMIHHLMQDFEARGEPFPDNLWAIMGLDEQAQANIMTTTTSGNERRLRTAEEMMQQLTSQRERDWNADVSPAGDVIH